MKIHVSVLTVYTFAYASKIVQYVSEILLKKVKFGQESHKYNIFFYSD